MMGTDEKVTPPHRSGVRARVFALAALSSVVAAVGYAGQQGYHAATDSFVAPTILSPDSDVVLAAKLKVSQLSVERVQTATELGAIDETLIADDRAIARLKGLQRTPESSHQFTSNQNARQVTSATTEEKMLLEQRAVVTEMASKQEHLVGEARANLEAGLISKTELMKELQKQNELQLALLENERTRHQIQTTVDQTNDAQRSIQGTAPPMPEVLAREEQLARIELEIVRLESDARAKRIEKKALTGKLVMLDELDGQMRSRPTFRASERSMDVAFVPYTQLGGVYQGAIVQDCIWGVFHCQPVGVVTEIVPGEVITPDPWGNQSRGQYAVLHLTNHESAKAKTLRVRPGAPPKNDPNASPERLSAR